MKLLLGIDLGTSFIKVAVVDAHTSKMVASAQVPDTEAAIICKMPGYAEQSPQTWWELVKAAIKKVNATKKFDPKDISAIGISYQMHGLVLVDKNKTALRDSIIWCDSRATDPNKYPYGNFTAGKLAWVKENEPETYSKIDKILLPGDYISMMLTGKITTTPSALSEGIFWDLDKDELSGEVFQHFQFDQSFIPAIKPVFDNHGSLLQEVAAELGLANETPVRYKAGDQLNNAYSLNAMNPGEVAATAGTSGVIYAISDHVVNDKQSRLNSFVHVNHSATAKRFGVLLCINGCGSAYQWLRKEYFPGHSYKQLNQLASGVLPGSDGLIFLPFGNGAERMLGNKVLEYKFYGLDENKHKPGHMIRAVQEGVAFAFRYGLDILRENRIKPNVIRAGRANMFLSDVFTESFVNATNTLVELYEIDGAAGAAIGAGFGEKPPGNLKPIKWRDPGSVKLYDELYRRWLFPLHMERGSG
jgi:xylulokinase